MDTKSERLRDACELAVQTFQKLNSRSLTISSPNLNFALAVIILTKILQVWLNIGFKAMEILKEIRKKKPRKISVEIINALEESLA